MTRHHHAAPVARGASRLWLAAALGLTGCISTAHSRRYEALQGELREATSRGDVPRRWDHEPQEDEDQEAFQRLLDGAELGRLDRESLVRAVLARNPSIAAAREAWRAALAAFPQVIALDDPMLEYSLAPLSIGSNEVSFGQVAGASQRFPWPGKLSLRGEVALAEAEAARDDFQAVRQRLALMAAALFDRYYAIARSIELNEEHLQLVESIQDTAEAQYLAARAPQQDPLQAELELAHVVHQGVIFAAERGVIVAQLNGLLHRRPDAPLAPPPAVIEPDLEDLPATGALQERALERRPELAAARAGIEARRAGLGLAELAYYPDLGVMSSYNSMWREEEHQFMVGVSINLPIQLGRRRGAVDEASASLKRAEAELARLADEVLVGVESARQRVVESQHVVRLYDERLLPAARAQVVAARAGYESGRNTFQALVDAERSVRTLELGYQSALAQLSQRRAELERATGDVPGLPHEGVEP